MNTEVSLMDLSNNFDRISANAKSLQASYSDSIMKIVKQNAKTALEDTYKKYSKIERRKIEEAFHDAVQDWYDSYTPVGEHPYSRHHSLFDALDLSYDANGLVEYTSIESLYNTSITIGDGRYGGLFQTIFMEGWHGGDTSSHRYRYPHPYYNRWGRIADRTESVDERFTTKMSELSVELDGDLQTISDNMVDISMEKINEEIIPVQEKYIKAILSGTSMFF